MPADLFSGLVDWIMADRFRVGLVLGWMAGAFMMFSILTGKWIVLDRIIGRVKRRW